MILIQQNSRAKSFFAILALLCLIVAPIQIAQAQITIARSSISNYDKYMRQGYAATAKKDYRTALINFRNALSIRPGDRYATNAIRNVSSYARRPGSKISDRPVPTGIGSPSGGSRIGAGSRLARINSSPDEINTSDTFNDVEIGTNSDAELKVAAPQTQAVQSCVGNQKRLTALVPLRHKHSSLKQF